MGAWEDDGGELVGIAGMATSNGWNLATYWKPGFMSPLEMIGLSISPAETDDGDDVLRVIAVIPPGNPLGKGKKGLLQIATMPGASWVPFEKTGVAALQIDFVKPV
ncbi:hypothetical protein [Agromyces rhizosphaerae]|uniref:hypothetical protein n=1 Tax=Agromyces rhizosphaerae TaxID=88374 RepID=UPI002492AF8A|nr:hypothetical protein [Agromyces rhizosphaerae]